MKYFRIRRDKDCRVLSIRLSILWVVSFLILAVVGFVVRARNAIDTGNLYISPLSAYSILVLISAIFYLLPLSLSILHCAKIARLKPIVIISSIISIILCVWCPLSLLATILAFMGVIP